METVAGARPPDGEKPEGPPPRNLRKELDDALRECTPKMRKWLKKIPLCEFQPWRAASELEYSTATISKWLRDDRVKLVRKLQDEIDIEDMDISRRRVLREYQNVAFADIRALFREDGTLLPPGEWPGAIAAAVEGIDTQERRMKGPDGAFIDEWELVRKVRIHGKMAALEFLAGHLKMAGAKRIEVTGKDGEPLQAPTPVIHFVERAD
jgi:hypothetical protein